MATVIQAPDEYLEKVDREKRTRRETAWIVHDLKSNTLLLTQKLKSAADFINLSLATAQREQVSQAGLYEASDTIGNRVDGCYKMRYRVTSCRLSDSHSKFNKLRDASRVANAMILTTSPQTYTLRKAQPASLTGLVFQRGHSIPPAKVGS